MSLMFTPNFKKDGFGTMRDRNQYFNGFRLFTRDINRVPLMMSEKKANQIGREPVFEKLGKSIIATKNLKKGKKIALDDIDGMIFEKQIIPIRETYKILNKK